MARESIVIDPAHDFGKNTFHSLEVTRRLGEMVATGWPVLVSLSNKDFVGETLDAADRRAPHRHAGRDRRCAPWPGPGSTGSTRCVETRQTVDMVWSIAGRRPPLRAIRGLQ